MEITGTQNCQNSLLKMRTKLENSYFPNLNILQINQDCVVLL